MITFLDEFCRKKWCCMWLVVGFPKPLIDLFHIGPAVHYHFGWDNPSCSLRSLYSPPSALHWQYWQYGPIYKLLTFHTARNPKMTPWHKHWFKKQKTFSPPQQCNNAPFLLLLFISTDHIGYFGRPVHSYINGHHWGEFPNQNVHVCK